MSHSIKANKRMTRLLQSLEREGLQHNDLDAELATLVEKGFVERYGCIFLAGFEDSARPKDSRKALVDKTGVECFANHLHIKDYIRADPPIHLQQGMMFAKKLASALHLYFPRTGFRIIVAQNSQGVIVRFHKLRPNEEWVSHNLETYKGDGICVLTVLPGGLSSKLLTRTVQ